MIFIVGGAEAVISFVMRSRVSWNVFVPLDNTSFGVQFFAYASVALNIALERCHADPAKCT